MANKLDQEARMTIQTLAGRGQSNRAIARLLGVHENAVRYHLHRAREAIADGRGQQKTLPSPSRTPSQPGWSGSMTMDR